MDLLSLPGATYKVITDIIYRNQSKNVILDPFTTICRLAVLSYLPKGTKIGIVSRRHEVIFFQPDYQGAWRLLYGDKQTDLHNLNHPIQKATQWYGRENEQINYIFKLAHKGLQMLKENYTGATYESLRTYDNVLTGKQIDMYDSVTPERAKQMLEEQTTDNAIHTQLKGLWNEDALNAVYSLFKTVEASMDDVSTRDEQIAVIQKFLDAKDKLTSGIVVKHTKFL